jgi:hypothetical protein
MWCVGSLPLTGFLELPSKYKEAQAMKRFERQESKRHEMQLYTLKSS